MLYRRMGKTGDSVSILGYGCMRFPQKNNRIDEERTEAQIMSAIERGVNYFDTAYIYPGSEAVLGRILAKNDARHQVLVATKLPLLFVHTEKDLEATFATSLERLQTDYIDYYLVHSLTSLAGWQRLCGLGVENFLAELKSSGRAKRLGFSYHGDKTQFSKIVDAFPWDFCQIQYNILDENFQAGKDGLQYAAGKGLGVIVMEPLRGGLLSQKVPAAAQTLWDSAPRRQSPAAWALRWVWHHPEVTLLLSGMNEEAHIDENIRLAGTATPGCLDAAELALVDQVKTVYKQRTKVGCTGCAYCLPCPAGVNIPGCFSVYNDLFLFNDRSFRAKYLTSLSGVDGGQAGYASLCRHCGACESRCPQHLPIQKLLAETAREMESFYFKPLAALIRLYYRLQAKRKNSKLIYGGNNER